MSLLSELKRRNVFRVGAAYAVTAWLVIQVVETILPAFGFGDVAVRVVTITLAIGLVPVLIFAWVFELTPEGLRKERDVDPAESINRATVKKFDRGIMVVLALGIAYFAFDKFVLDPAQDAELQEAAVQRGIQQAKEEERLGRFSDKSVAVLPFANWSNREEDRFFTDGMHDELLGRLARIAALKVISRTSVLRYRDSDLSIPEIAKQLAVATILEGGVQRSGNQVRINVQLIDARTDEHLWAETYDRELTAENLFAIQSEISTRIAESLDATLSPAETKLVNDSPTQNLEAYNHYLNGRQLMVNNDAKELKLALAEFRQAVDLDPDFALAWVGIADAVHLLRGFGGFGATEFLEDFTAAVNRALALNDQLGEAYVPYGHLLLLNGQYEEHIEAYKKAIELAPNYARAYHVYATILKEPEELKQKLALNQKAVQLDPLIPPYQINLAATLLMMGKEQEAMRQYQGMLERFPDYSYTYMSIAGFHAQNGKLAEAVVWGKKALEKNPNRGEHLVQLAERYLDLQDFEAAARLRQTMTEVLSPDAWQFDYLDMMVLGHKGDLQGTLDLLDAIPQGRSEMRWVRYGKGTIHYSLGHFELARNYLSKLEDWWLDAPPDCTHAHLLMATGDQEEGRKFLQEALHYYEVTLPALVQHTHKSPALGICYLVAGDTAKALDFFEQRTAHGHFFKWWFNKLYYPLWAPLQEDPRYIALDKEIEDLIAEQRELLQQMEESG